MKIRCNRKVERAAVNAARAFFESCDCVFQEVDLANDYGKDAYVDLTERDNVTGLCVAVQVKGGASYRRPGGYGIPLDENHASLWRQSSVPVAGIVYDPDDQQLRWCSISEFVERAKKPLPSYIPVDSANVLSSETLETAFRPCFHSYQSQRAAGPALLRLTSDDDSERCVALLDCFGLGRSDPAVLILLRHLLGMLNDEELRLGIHILAHATPHPDIFWHKGNWIPEAVCARVRPHLQWSEVEIAKLMNAVSWEEWHRGCPGQDLYSILCVDPKIEAKMRDVAIGALREGDEELAFSAMYLVIYWAGREGREMYEGFLRINRGFGELPLSRELESVLSEFGRVTLFE